MLFRSANKSGVVTDNLGGFQGQSGSSSTVNTVGYNRGADGTLTLTDPGSQTTGNSGLISSTTTANQGAATTSLGTNNSGAAFTATNDPDSGVNAFFGAGSVITANDASAVASEKISVRSVAGGGAIGAAAFGAAVSVVTIKSNTQAYAGVGAEFNLTGNLVIRAEMKIGRAHV